MGSNPIGRANLTGCNVSLVRRLALDARGRRFESYHPDQINAGVA